jgi:hypothetical protein
MTGYCMTMFYQKFHYVSGTYCIARTIYLSGGHTLVCTCALGNSNDYSSNRFNTFIQGLEVGMWNTVR